MSAVFWLVDHNDDAPKQVRLTARYVESAYARYTDGHTDNIQEPLLRLFRKADPERLRALLSGGELAPRQGRMPSIVTAVTAGGVDLSSFQIYQESNRFFTSRYDGLTSHQRSKKRFGEREMSRELAGEDRNVRRAKAGLPPLQPQIRIYHLVPFKDRAEAKAEGMRWDPDKRSWYHVSKSASDASKFEKAIKTEAQVNEDSAGRTFRYRITNMKTKNQVQVRAPNGDDAVMMAIKKAGTGVFDYPLVVQNLDLDQMVHITDESQYDAKIKRVDQAAQWSLAESLLNEFALDGGDDDGRDERSGKPLSWFKSQPGYSDKVYQAAYLMKDMPKLEACGLGKFVDDVASGDEWATTVAICEQGGECAQPHVLLPGSPRPVYVVLIGNASHEEAMRSLIEQYQYDSEIFPDDDSGDMFSFCVEVPGGIPESFFREAFQILV